MAGKGQGEAGRGLPRREFIGTVAAGVAGLTLPPSPFPLPPDRIGRIGLQLYTVRDLLKQDFDGTLARIAAIGYREVEFAGYFDHSPQQVRAALAQAGLEAPGAHVSFEELESGDAVLHTASLIGHRYVVCAWIPEERRRTVDDWKRVGDQLNQTGAACRAAGLQLAYHNHSYEFVPLGGRLPYDVLLESTDTSVLQLELDLFWITFGGGDPLVYFARYPGRFPLVHVKDMIPKPSPDVEAERVMVDVGKGHIDWKRIFARARVAGIQHYFVEHDQPPDPWASIQASYTYLHDLEF